DPDTFDDLARALAALSRGAGRLDPALVRALVAPSPWQRAAAAWVLGRDREGRGRVIALLRDPSPLVRRRGAGAPLPSRDARGLTTAIDLTAAEGEVAMHAEALLQQLAGTDTPALEPGATRAERRTNADRWALWYRVHGVRLDLTKLDLESRLLGLRLVVAINGYSEGGAAWEYDAARRERWKQLKLGGPFDVRVLPGNKLLVAEYSARRVTERDRDGKVLWDHVPDNSPLEVQRLPGGNTLIVTNTSIVEL